MISGHTWKLSNVFGHKVSYSWNDLSPSNTYLHVYNIFLLPANLNRTDSLVLVFTLLFCIYQHISILVLLTFGAGLFSVGAVCLVHFRVFISIPNNYPLDAITSSQYDHQTCLQRLPHVPLLLYLYNHDILPIALHGAYLINIHISHIICEIFCFLKKQCISQY